MVVVDKGRAEQLSKAFSTLGLEKVLIFEELDPQLTAAKLISEKCGSLTPHIVFTNALVSYQLGMLGEDYWLSFARLMVRECPKSYEEIPDKVARSLNYLHRFAVRAKEKRLSRLKACIETYEPFFVQDLNALRYRVARCLNANVDDKTIVFAVKMMYYGMKALGVDVTLPHDIPIPVDRRVIKISLMSDLIIPDEPRVMERSINDLVSDLFKKPQIVRDAWRTVSLGCGIPPLHLDAVLWFFGKYVNCRSKTEVFERVVNELGTMNVRRIGMDCIKLLINELLHELPH